MTDNAFLIAVLNDGRWHSNAEILQASIRERGCGLTVHSRASDLRKLGYTVETRVGTNGNRRVSFYRLVGKVPNLKLSPVHIPESAVSSSASTLFDLPAPGAYDDGTP